MLGYDEDEISALVRLYGSQRPRCQHADCTRKATRRELWRIDDAGVVVRLCDEHAFKGPGTRLISAERWSTRTRLARL